MIDRTTLASAQALIDAYTASLQTLTGPDKVAQAQVKARELNDRLAALGISSPDDLRAARKTIERQDYRSRLLNGVWETGSTLKVVDLGTLTRDQSISTRNDALNLSDTITYHFYSHPKYVLAAADTPEGREIARRASGRGVEIFNYYSGLAHSLLHPPTKHVFRMVSRSFSNTLAMKDSFLSLVTRALHSLGVELEIYPDSNNLKAGNAKIGLVSLRLVSATGVEKPKLWENRSIPTNAAIGLSINEEWDSELAKYIFGDSGLETTGLKKLIGGVSPATMFRALSAVRG